MNDEMIFKFLSNEELAIEYCMNEGLLKQEHFCCGKSVNNQRRQTRRHSGYFFRCSAKNCRKEISIRKGSFFEKSHLRIGQILMLIFHFTQRETQLKSLKRKTGITSDETIVDWLSFFREVCAHYFERHQTILGGVTHIVEIDEAVLCRRKYNRGRPVREQWVLGMRDVTTNEGYICSIPDRRNETIIPLIQQHVLPGTIICTDGARVYQCVNNLGYFHMTCNHSIGEFVNYENGATVNHVESAWQKIKQESKNRYGTHRSTLDSHLITYMWFNKFGCDYESFINEIKTMYRLN